MRKALLFIIAFLMLLSQAFAQSGEYVPPEGKILLMVGQDRDSIDAYVNNMGISPAGFMVYTSIQQAKGLYEPVDFGAGVQHSQYLIEKYPNTVIQMGLYMVGTLDGVLEGFGDESIDKIGRWIKEAGKPVYLRIGYEFDYPDNHYEPEKYKKVYRYIVDKLRKNNVNNVAYVWHSYAASISRPVTDWYPGDEYVDWFGISCFGNRNEYMDSMAELALKHNKPLMIAEATPHGIGTKDPDAWDKWFQGLLDFVYEKNVKAICYINADWNAQPMWKGQGWGDARVQVNKVVKKRWLDEIKKERYLHASPQLYKILAEK